MILIFLKLYPCLYSLIIHLLWKIHQILIHKRIKVRLNKREEWKHNGGFPSKDLYMSIAWLHISKQIGRWFENSTSHWIVIRSDVGKKKLLCITYILSSQLHVYVCYANWKVSLGSFPCNHVHTSKLRNSTDVCLCYANWKVNLGSLPCNHVLTSKLRISSTQAICSRSSMIECFEDWDATPNVTEHYISQSNS